MPDRFSKGCGSMKSMYEGSETDSMFNVICLCCADIEQADEAKVRDRERLSHHTECTGGIVNSIRRIKAVEDGGHLR